MAYVDGFIIPLPTKNLKVYRRIAQKFGKPLVNFALWDQLPW